MYRARVFLSAALLCAAMSVPAPLLRAADHRDAPAVDGAGEGDITDVFAFLDPNNKNRLVLAMGVNPLSVPALTHSYRFSNEYLYQFKIDIDGDAKEDLVIQAAFHNAPSGQAVRIRIAVPDPNYVGASNRFFENAPSQLEGPVEQVFGDPNDIQIFAGQRDDPFVLDGQFFRIVNGTQDVFRNIPTSPLGPLRGRTLRADGTSGVDLFAGFNASFIVVSIPVSFVASGRDIINVWGTVSAPLEQTDSYIQFERMGQPLFNTVFIPGALKDAFNQGVPADDNARWARFVPDALTTTATMEPATPFPDGQGCLPRLG